MIINPAVYTYDTIKETADKWRAAGLVVVFTNGCFDLIHTGHVRYLKQARELGDLLVVGVNTDESISAIKGEDRPVMKLADRLEILLALRWVDAVVPFSDSTPTELIRHVRPQILVKGGDWPLEKIAGREIVESYGGETVSLPFHDGTSTTAIINRIRSSSR
jgi:D-beta-D-heptose 7-phosphate kinase/D-beta-D-heptose 1-phosphate adenosyltransferase